ncbi:MAG: hypothetical protein R2877_04945 [Bdellovibrionota bacterium]
MKNITKIFMGLVVALPMLVSQDAFAEHYRGNSRSNHYVRGQTHQHVRPNNAVGPRTTYTTRHGVYRPRVVQRHVHYRPYYRPVVMHYHPGFYDPCYDTFHTNGVYWNVNVGSGGLGIGIQSGW